MTFSIGVAPGIFIMLSRLILLPPTFYEKTKINKKCKYITFILSITLTITEILMF